MSIQEKIRLLEELSALDQEIRQVDDTLDSERSELKGQRERLDQLKTDIEKYDGALVELNETRTRLAKEVRALGTQVDKAREKMSRARNERETNAATREFEDLKRIQKDREEEIGRIQLLEADTLKKSEEAKESAKQVEQLLDTSEGEANSRIRKLERTKKKHLAQREKLTTQLPRRLVSRYDTIRKRRGIAIATANGGSCSACHMALPPQLYQKILRSNDIEQCPSCRRIVYYRPESVEEANSET